MVNLIKTISKMKILLVIRIVKQVLIWMKNYGNLDNLQFPGSFKEIQHQWFKRTQSYAFIKLTKFYSCFISCD
jgi:hypothetical protein